MRAPILVALVAAACGKAGEGERPLRWALEPGTVRAYDYTQELRGVGGAGTLTAEGAGTMFVRGRGAETADVLLHDLQATVRAADAPPTWQKLPDLLIDGIKLDRTIGKASENDWSARLLLTLPRRHLAPGEKETIAFEIPVQFEGERFVVGAPLEITRKDPVACGERSCAALESSLSGESGGISLSVRGTSSFDLTERALHAADLTVTIAKGSARQENHVVLARAPAKDTTAPK